MKPLVLTYAVTGPFETATSFVSDHFASMRGVPFQRFPEGAYSKGRLLGLRSRLFWPEGKVPLLEGAEDLVRSNLASISRGERAGVVIIGTFTAEQFASINRSRAALGLHVLESNEILFIGRHVYNSRVGDGYTIEDIVTMIRSAMHESSVVMVNRGMSAIQNPNSRDDAFGNAIFDRAVFEMTNRKPRAELLSVIPKGDRIKPYMHKSPP